MQLTIFCLWLLAGGMGCFCIAALWTANLHVKTGQPFWNASSQTDRSALGTNLSADQSQGFGNNARKKKWLLSLFQFQKPIDLLSHDQHRSWTNKFSDLIAILSDNLHLHLLSWASNLILGEFYIHRNLDNIKPANMHVFLTGTWTAWNPVGAAVRKASWKTVKTQGSESHLESKTLAYITASLASCEQASWSEKDETEKNNGQKK